MKAILVTGRSLGQGLGIELGKFSDLYHRNVTICEMNPEDMNRMGIKAGSHIRITTKHGSVVVRAIEALEEVPPGIVFIPYGPWINRVVRPETHGTGMPSFKGVEVEIEAAEVNDILKTEDLIEGM